MTSSGFSSSFRTAFLGLSSAPSFSLPISFAPRATSSTIDDFCFSRSLRHKSVPYPSGRGSRFMLQSRPRREFFSPIVFHYKITHKRFRGWNFCSSFRPRVRAPLWSSRSRSIVSRKKPFFFFFERSQYTELLLYLENSFSGDIL